jgi:hypothetical protein
MFPFQSTTSHKRSDYPDTPATSNQQLPSMSRACHEHVRSWHLPISGCAARQKLKANCSKEHDDILLHGITERVAEDGPWKWNSLVSACRFSKYKSDKNA